MYARQSRYFRLFLLLLLACVAVVTQAKVWSADDVPMVHLQDSTRYVCDPEGLLAVEARDSADVLLSKLHHQGGVQTVFVVVGNVKNADCFRMAQDIGNKHGVGTKADRRGLVIVIAVADRRYFIAPGKGLEADLTDIECDDIARAFIIKNMKADNIDGAVVETAYAVTKKLTTGKSVVVKQPANDEADAGSLLWTLFLLAIFFWPITLNIIYWILEKLGLKDPDPPHDDDHGDGQSGLRRNRRNNFDDIIGGIGLGGGSFRGGGMRGGGGFSGGSFGGGSFGGGGAGGGW